MSVRVASIPDLVTQTTASTLILFTGLAAMVAEPANATTQLSAIVPNGFIMCAPGMRMASASSRPSLLLDVAPISRVADRRRHAVAILDDPDAVAHLHIAIVGLRDDDRLPGVLLGPPLEPALASATAAADGGARDGAADGAQQAADQGAAHRMGRGRADRGAARGSQAAAAPRAIADA